MGFSSSMAPPSPFRGLLTALWPYGLFYGAIEPFNVWDDVILLSLSISPFHWYSHTPSMSHSSHSCQPFSAALYEVGLDPFSLASVCIQVPSFGGPILDPCLGSGTFEIAAFRFSLLSHPFWVFPSISLDPFLSQSR